MTSPSTDRRYGVSPGLGIKAPVVVAAITAITLTGEQTVDGIACVSGDRVLVMGQTDTTANGIYDCDTGAWTRSIDANGNRDFVDGTLVLVNGGSYANTLMAMSATNPIVIGTSSLVFLNSGLFSTSHTDYTAAGGETVIAVGITYSMESNALSVFKNGLRQDIGNDFTETSITSVTFASALSADDVISFYVNQNAGQLILGTVTSDLVTYTPAGSGAQPTTVQTKLRESVSVADFGASPSASAAVNDAAFNAALASGAAEILIPAGNYQKSATWSINRGVRISGALGQTSNTISTSVYESQITYSGTAAAVQFTGASGVINGPHNIHLSNLAITGNASSRCSLLAGTGNDETAASYRYVFNGSVTNVSCSGNTTGSGLEVYASQNFIFTNIQAGDNTYGIRVWGINTLATFLNCWIKESNSIHAWLLDGSTDLTTTTALMVNILLINCCGENSGNAGLCIQNGVAGIELYGYHSENNNTSAGTAPVYIRNTNYPTQASPTYVKFFGGSIQDPVSDLVFDINYCAYVSFHDVTLNSYTTNFMKVTANSLYLIFEHSNPAYLIDKITGNTYTGVTKGGRTSINAIKVSDNQWIAGKTGTAVSGSAAATVSIIQDPLLNTWTPGSYLIRASATDANSGGHVAAWWFYDVIVYGGVTVPTTTSKDSGGDVGSFSLAFGSDAAASWPGNQTNTITVTATNLDYISVSAEVNYGRTIFNVT